MGTGYRGTFVISWSQTEIDGFQAAPPSSLTVGAAWSWRGEPVRVDGPSSILQLDQSDGETNIRKRAARMVRRLVGAAIEEKTRLEDVEIDHPLADCSFVVTDGTQSYTVTLIEVGTGAPPLLMFLDEMPPRERDLWVVHHALDPWRRSDPVEQASGVICFTPGTRILTATGEVPIEALREGDLVQTKDNGLQEVCWTGSRRMTGARLFAMPKLRPIRIRAGAFGIGEPGEEIIVSPEHRMLLKGVVARALFNTPEVLVAARDLVNGRSVTLDTQSREVTYHHLLLPRHEVLFANGLETESFHPANTAPSALDDADRARLARLMPQIFENPHIYGSYARRNLSSSEAAILLHEAA
ncbi:Hint domain-containing protein [Pseudoponticoccus marisrubri]|uniref:Hemolysin-type calcium-binding protein n=1 Tax=Pseudoponticoccus marisrubri TaxID=1685382 RepID=A0A0W7WI67_9RHOB|nr:Hint domain-containing protein [Pseudoponticoccus marisrubri]KUF10184.1 hemolysin-type calcium-binding protein [Pseudoponticoccus marisrubri]